MRLIEPCCAPKQLLALRSKLGDNGTAFWYGHGDLSLAELLPPMLKRYSETEIIIVAPVIPDAAHDIIKAMMERQWMSMNGKKKIDNIKHLTLITDLRKKKSPKASEWLKNNPFGDRLTLKNVQQNDTAILLPDIVFFGNINLTYGGNFTAVASKNSVLISEMRKNYTIS